MSRDDIYAIMLTETAQILAISVSDIGGGEDLLELGLDSLAFVQLLVTIHDKCGVELSPGDLFVSPTIEALTDVVFLKLRRPA